MERRFFFDSARLKTSCLENGNYLAIMILILKTEKDRLKIFLAGIMQGSCREPRIHNQEYRLRLKKVLEETLVEADVYCPFQNHPRSLGYAKGRMREVFFEHIEKASHADIIVAYLPEASMGSAIEIWEAFRKDKIILTISPLKENWVIKTLATRNFLSIDEFENFLRAGRMKELPLHGRKQKKETLP